MLEIICIALGMVLCFAGGFIVCYIRDKKGMNDFDKK